MKKKASLARTFDAEMVNFNPNNDEPITDIVDKLRITFERFGIISGCYDYANGNCHVKIKFESKEVVNEVMKLKYKDVKQYLEGYDDVPHPLVG